MDDSQQYSSLTSVPLLPLRNMVSFPGMAVSLHVGREISYNALQEAVKNDGRIILLAQKDGNIDAPGHEDFYQIGMLASILQVLKLPAQTFKVMVEGLVRVHIDKLHQDGYFMADATAIPSIPIQDQTEEQQLLRLLQQKFEEFSENSKKISEDGRIAMARLDSAGRYADAVVSHLSLDISARQQLLEMADDVARVRQVVTLLDTELSLNEMDEDIRKSIKKQMEQNQREYYLNEQLKAIQKELGDLNDKPTEMELLDMRIREARMPKDAEEKAKSELDKLKQMQPMSSEASVVRSYLDWLVGLPWSKRSRLTRSLEKAMTILENDHYGLEEVKERIIEYLAVQLRVRKIRGPVLCLVGPPGVGKTSVGESIARATGRKFVRLALGGVRDEAEIRGHRRTYIGSMPGKLIQRISRVDTKNPLVLLDEVDKMGMDHRGDPAAALLEVLDSEQNKAFNDHYLEVDYDLSEVMFICTANTMDIPEPLLDRMEVIRIPGYTEEEKFHIADHYLLPKQIERNGLYEGEIAINEAAFHGIIRHYTREAGVRNLEREIAKLCRKVVYKHGTRKGTKTAKITSSRLADYLGVRKFRSTEINEDDRIGVVNGLAWTQAGGQLLTIEATFVAGSGKLVRTGSLGNVMQESVEAALTSLRARSSRYGIDSSFFSKHDVHLHLPEGAIPKDGPSAGIAIATALASAACGVEVRRDIAMTGEITLQGDVLAIGGLKEKLLAARRCGVRLVLIPEQNEHNLAEVPENLLEGLEIEQVTSVDQVFEYALVRALRMPDRGELPSTSAPSEDISIQPN